MALNKHSFPGFFFILESMFSSCTLPNKSHFLRGEKKYAAEFFLFLLNLRHRALIFRPIPKTLTQLQGCSVKLACKSFQLCFFISPDIDECVQPEPVCTQEHQDCVNTKGGYLCICSGGYEEQDGKCVQIAQPGEL